MIITRYALRAKQKLFLGAAKFGLEVYESESKPWAVFCVTSHSVFIPFIYTFFFFFMKKSEI